MNKMNDAQKEGILQGLDRVKNHTENAITGLVDNRMKEFNRDISDLDDYTSFLMSDVVDATGYISNAVAKKKAKKDEQKSIVERAEKLVESLIDVFGYTDSQLICTMASNEILQRLCKIKLNGEQPAREDVSVDEPNNQPIVAAFEPPHSQSVQKRKSI